MSKMGIVIGVSSAYSAVFDTVIDRGSISGAAMCSGKVVSRPGEPDPFAVKLERLSTELSMFTVSVAIPVSGGGEPRA
jgi:hypothetical protein